MAKAPRAGLRLIDRLVLVVAWVVTCGIVYVLGFYLGRGMEDRRPASEERMVRLPVTSQPPPEGQRPKDEKEFPSFYQALPAGQQPPEVARATPPPTAAAPAARPAVPPVASATTTTLARPGATSTTLAHAGVATSTTVAHVTGTTYPPSAPSPAPLAHPTGTTYPPSATPPPTLAGPGPLPPRGPSWTVEASPTRSRAEAEQVLANLKRRGYDAVLVQVQRDGDTWYRLRVGRYASAEQASEVMKKLRENEGVAHAFVASE
jgi:cell division septation protein DedD